MALNEAATALDLQAEIFRRRGFPDGREMPTLMRATGGGRLRADGTWFHSVQPTFPTPIPTMNTSTRLIAMILSGRQPSYDDIASRAFEIYVTNGKPDGRDREHWRRAEEELLRRPRVNQSTLSRL